MAENRKDPQGQGTQRDQNQNQGQGQQQGGRTDQNPNRNREDENEEEGTKLPGKETRTPVADSKTGTQGERREQGQGSQERRDENRDSGRQGM